MSRRSILLVGTLTSITVAALLIAVAQVRSPEQVAADAAPPPPSEITAVVQERVLVEDIILRCTVRPGASIPVPPPPGGTGDTAVVTRVTAEVGDRIGEGELLLDVSGGPLFALALPFPLYRDLRSGDRGPDVSEVQRALRRLDRRVKVTGVVDAATLAGVEKLYRDMDYDVPREPLPAAEVPDPEPVPPTTAPVLRRSAVVVVDRADRLITQVHARVGLVVLDPTAPLFALDGEPPSLAAVATRERAALVEPGRAALVIDDITGEQTTAEVTAISTEPTTDPSGNAGFEIVLRFVGEPVAESGERTVRVEIEAAGSREPVLAVPVTAVSSRPDGVTFVTAVDGLIRRDMEVTTGLRADGWVEVTAKTPEALRPGTPVVVGVGPG